MTSPAPLTKKTNIWVLSLLQGAYAFLWTFLLMSLVQSMVADMVGEKEKESATQFVLTVGLALGLVAYPISGYVSDKIRHPWARRHGMILVGVLGGVLGMMALPFTKTPFQLMIIFSWTQFFGTIASAPYFALIPDLIPQEDRGKASGAQGLADLLGSVGAFVFQMFTLGNPKGMQQLVGSIGLNLSPVPAASFVICFVMILLLLLGLVFILFLVPVPIRSLVNSEVSAQGKLPDDYIHPNGLSEAQRKKGMVFLILSRIFNTAGVTAIQSFLIFYILDYLKAGSMDKANQYLGILMVIVSFATVPTVVMTGWWVDKYGRKIFLIASSIVMMVVSIGFMNISSLNGAYVLGALFGLGFGMFKTSDWALAVDLVPGHDSGAFTLGVWQSSLVLGQIIGVPIAGSILTWGHDALGHPNGFKALFTMVAISLFVALLLVGPVPETLKKVKEKTAS